MRAALAAIPVACFASRMSFSTRLAGSLTESLFSGLAGLADLAVPPQCLMCDTLTAEPGACCAQCWQKLRFISEPYCAISGRPFEYDPGAGAVSPEVLAAPPPYNRARAAVIYDSASKGLVTRLKYGDRLDLAPWMAQWMVRAGRELLEPGVIVLPVPLHATRRIGRRYNQSAELARHVAKSCGLDCRPGLLTRSRKTRQQVGLSASKRERNVAGAFRVPAQARGVVRGSNLLLVDDVFTSGATANAACRVLLRAGAARVDILTFARVEPTATEALYTA